MVKAPEQTAQFKRRPDQWNHSQHVELGNTKKRAWVKVGKTDDKLLKWELTTSSECLCSDAPLTIDHILCECILGFHYSNLDINKIK